MKIGGLNNLLIFIQKNGFRIIIEPDIYDDYEGNLFPFLESCNLSIQITASHHNQPNNFTAEFVYKLGPIKEDERGVRSYNEIGMKTNKQYYGRPDFTEENYGKNMDEYYGECLYGFGSSIHESIMNLLEQIGGKYLALPSKKGGYNFIAVPNGLL